MARRPASDGLVLKQVALDAEAWAELQGIVDKLHISRTDALNRALKFMVREKWVPGFAKKEEVGSGEGE